MPDTTAKLLIVDDLPENLLALNALIRQEGRTVFQASSGEEALSLLLEHEFALAILDVQMPGMNGFELADQAIQGCWDEFRIQQVIINLLTNALRYGDGKLVSISLVAVPEGARIDVCDHGKGIPAGDQQRISARTAY